MINEAKETTKVESRNKYITKANIINGKPRGFLVQVIRKGERFHNLFGFHSYGGMPQALDRAILCREEALRIYHENRDDRDAFVREWQSLKDRIAAELSEIRSKRREGK